MVAIERIHEYAELDSESNDGEDEDLLEHWPRKGEITMSKASFRYHSSLPVVLDKISCNINDKEKVIVFFAFYIESCSAE